MIKSTIGDSTSVGTWLGSLDKSQQDAFKHYAKNAASDIEAYLYARFLKPSYTGSISDLTAWVQEKYPKEDLRKILLIEIDSLKTDLHNVRQMTLTGMLDHATAATKIAVLQKEIRSHIQAVRQLTDGMDRRGLLLAGADRCMRELMNSFEDAPTTYSSPIASMIVVCRTKKAHMTQKCAIPGNVHFRRRRLAKMFTRVVRIVRRRFPSMLRDGLGRAERVSAIRYRMRRVAQTPKKARVAVPATTRKIVSARCASMWPPDVRTSVYARAVRCCSCDGREPARLGGR